MDITVNGNAQTLDAGATVADLVNILGLGDKRIAVELNMEIVPRSQHALTDLAHGDSLEVVHAIGGG